MTNAGQYLIQAKVIARKVVEGITNPNEGCSALVELCEGSGWPDELLPFSALAHEQTGHEAFGFDAVNSAPLIVEACLALLGESSR